MSVDSALTQNGTIPINPDRFIAQNSRNFSCLYVERMKSFAALVQHWLK
jgi:hypothetical protein